MTESLQARGITCTDADNLESRREWGRDLVQQTRTMKGMEAEADPGLLSEELQVEEREKHKLVDRVVSRARCS